MVATWKEIVLTSSIPLQPLVRPRPRTSHTCVPYKGRYLIVVGGEAEEIKTNKVASYEEVTENKEGEVKKEALSDVWIFDTFYRQWKELKDLHFKI